MDKKLLHIIPIILFLICSPLFADVTTVEKTLRWAAYKSGVETNGSDDFIFTLQPATGIDGDWDITKKLDSVPFTFFEWSAETDGKTTTCNVNPISVTFTISGPLVNTKVPTASVDYTLLFSLKNTQVKFQYYNSGTTYYTLNVNSTNLDYYYLGYLGYFGYYYFSLKDTITGVTYQNEEFSFSLSSDNCRTNTITYTPTANYYYYPEWQDVTRGYYGLLREVEGTLQSLGDRKSLPSGKYEATLTITVTTT